MFYELSSDGYHGLMWKKILPSDWKLKSLKEIIIQNTKSSNGVTLQPLDGIRFLCYDEDFEDEFLHEFTQNINPNTDEGLDILYLAAEEFVYTKNIGFSDVSILKSPRSAYRDYYFIRLIGNKSQFLNDIINLVGIQTHNYGDFIYPSEKENAKKILYSDIQSYLKFYDTPETFLANGLCEFYVQSYNDADNLFRGNTK